MKLRRYWFEFDVDPKDWGHPNSLLRAGCGVTGPSLNDCLELIRRRILGGGRLPAIRRVVEDVDISTLDAKHVLPNMGLVTKPGIWFPTGYD